MFFILYPDERLLVVVAIMSSGKVIISPVRGSMFIEQGPSRKTAVVSAGRNEGPHSVPLG
jgi:hypothetical protein